MLMHLLTTALNWNYVLVTAISASLTAQLIKVLLNLFIFHRFIAERMWGAGGMPSSHSATVCALSTAALMTYGVGSYEFAISFILAIIVMHDAMGVRRETGIQARVLNELLDVFAAMDSDMSPQDKLKEFVGHTPLQVLIGSLLGITIAIIICSVL